MTVRQQETLSRNYGGWQKEGRLLKNCQHLRATITEHFQGMTWEREKGAIRSDPIANDHPLTHLTVTCLVCGGSQTYQIAKAPHWVRCFAEEIKERRIERMFDPTGKGGGGNIPQDVPNDVPGEVPFSERLSWGL